MRRDHISVFRSLEAAPTYAMDDLTSSEFVDNPELHISVHALYSCCLDTLKSISAVELQDENFKTYYTRLKIWGAGLFTERPSLNKILEEEPERYRPLLTSLQKTLFSIAVEEGRFSVSATRPISINLAIVVFLKSRRALNGNYDIDLQLEPRTKRLLDLVSQPSEACHEDYVMYLGDFVESLFDLLPSIRGIRRTRLLENEFHQSNKRSSSLDLVALPGSKIQSDRDNTGSRTTKTQLRPPPYSSSLDSSYITRSFGFSVSDLFVSRQLAFQIYSRFFVGDHAAGNSTFYCCSPLLWRGV